MNVEIVLDEHDGLGVRQVNVGQIRQDVGIIDGGVAVRHLDVAPAFERREHYEQVGGAVALFGDGARCLRGLAAALDGDGCTHPCYHDLSNVRRTRCTTVVFTNNAQ